MIQSVCSSFSSGEKTCFTFMRYLSREEFVALVFMDNQFSGKCHHLHHRVAPFYLGGGLAVALIECDVNRHGDFACIVSAMYIF